MTELIKRATAQDLVNQRDALLASLLSQLTALDNLSLQAERAGVVIDSDIMRWAYCSTGREERVRKMVDRKMWDRILYLTGIRELLDAKRTEAFERQIEIDPPVITLDIIVGTLQGLAAQQDQMIRDNVLDVHGWLLGRYATHKGKLFPQKWILEGYFANGYLSIYYHDRIRDIDRIVAMAKGAKMPGLHTPGTLLEALRLYRFRSGVEPECEDWEVKIFKNGNIHLKAKDPSMIDALNKILIESGHYLP